MNLCWSHGREETSSHEMSEVDVALAFLSLWRHPFYDITQLAFRLPKLGRRKLKYQALARLVRFLVVVNIFSLSLCRSHSVDSRSEGVSGI